jgi:hypothetical protein
LLPIIQAEYTLDKGLQLTGNMHRSEAAAVGPLRGIVLHQPDPKRFANLLGSAGDDYRALCLIGALHLQMVLLCKLYNLLYIGGIGPVLVRELFRAEVGSLVGRKRAQSVRLGGEIASRRARANFYGQLDDFMGVDWTHNVRAGNQLALAAGKRHVLMGGRICHGERLLIGALEVANR